MKLNSSTVQASGKRKMQFSKRYMVKTYTDTKIFWDKNHLATSELVYSADNTKKLDNSKPKYLRTFINLTRQDPTGTHSVCEG